MKMILRLMIKVSMITVTQFCDYVFATLKVVLLYIMGRQKRRRKDDLPKDPAWSSKNRFTSQN